LFKFILRSCLPLLFMAWALFFHGVPAFAQAAKAPAPAPAPSAQAAKDAPPLAPQAIQVSDIAVQAEAALSDARRIGNRSRIDDLVQITNEELPALARLAALRNAETQQLLRQNAALDTIRGLEDGWRDIELRATTITRELTRSATQLDRDLADLSTLEATWNATRIAAASADAPAAVSERIRNVLDSIGNTKKVVLDRRGKVLALQSRAAEMAARGTEARSALADASERAVSRLFYRDSQPLWRASIWQASASDVSHDAIDSLADQGKTLIDYVNAQMRNFVFHGLFFGALCVALLIARSKVRVLGETNTGLRRASRVYEMPFLSAMLIALLFSAWFYPRPPRALWLAISVLGTIPVLLFARRVIEAHLYPILYAIVGFYLVDKLRTLFTPLPGVARMMFLAETVFLILFLLWTLQVSRRDADAPGWIRTTAWRVVRAGTWVTLTMLALAFLSDAFGYVRLAALVLGTTLESAYTALVLYALTRVGEGLLQGALHLPPLCYLGMVQRHKPLLIHRFNRWIKWLAALLWIALTLQIPGLLQPLYGWARTVWDASASIGSLKPSIGDAIIFVLVVWGAFTLSRFARFLLEEEVFPKLRLERGLPYAISTMVHYVILLTGLVIALGAIGVDMTKFTIVAGAFSVGIGFGLQNIVNNFVSGLIVLFERPVKVGDTIQVDDMVGRVQHIGIRASIVHSTTGAEVIIPNGKLISDKVINWTLSSKLRQITIPVSTKSDADVGKFRAILLDIAAHHDKVVDKPAPEVLFIKRGIDAFDFELRIWTADLDAWLEVRSDLITEINEALKQNEMAAKDTGGTSLIVDI
jgi:small-conductance mechanosensitive channel